MFATTHLFLYLVWLKNIVISGAHKIGILEGELSGDGLVYFLFVEWIYLEMFKYSLEYFWSR